VRDFRAQGTEAGHPGRSPGKSAFERVPILTTQEVWRESDHRRRERAEVHEDAEPRVERNHQEDRQPPATAHGEG
jgi:hypothetical protein